MHEHKVKLTWEAMYDVVDIAEYIEAEFGIDRADKFQTDIQRQFDQLDSMAGVYGNTYLLYRGYSIYKKLFLPSIIFYIIDEGEKEVHVLRVLREESNWQKILSEKQTYSFPE